jgi:hypothetical protein
MNIFTITFYILSLFGYSQYIPNKYLPKQYVPIVEFGGRPARRIAPPPRSRVYRQYQYPPKIELSKEARRKSKESDENKGQFVDWKNYNTVSYCEVCKNNHSGGNCKLPRNKK